jgi:ABC-type transport system substrate-binding protein
VPQGGGSSRLKPGATNSGTGPFVAGPASSRRLQLSRYTGWWGSPLGLGPALDAVSFVAAPADSQRLDLLENGAAQIADPLGAAALAKVSADPLLNAVGGPSGGIGLEGSVRGIGSARAVPLLSRVWLTNLVG